MHSQAPLSIQAGGRLMDLSVPKVMGILNVTPDSFYSGSRMQSESGIAARTEQMLAEGVDIIDIGACSSRPFADEVPAEEEMRRLRKGLSAVRRVAPDTVVSVDTYRADAAAMCVEEYGADIINDISAGEADGRMFDTVARLNVPYVMMHMQGTPRDMQQAPHYDHLLMEVTAFFARRIDDLHERGVNDIILDPGFGFGKTMEHNYRLLAGMDELLRFGLPLLAGVSRKSMVYGLLGCTPDEALNGTTAANMLALCKGASILRVHDVKACTEAVKIFNMMKQQK